MAFVESTVRVEFPGSVIAHLLCRRCTVKKTVACYPASAERKVNVEPSREIYFSGGDTYASRSFLDCVYLLDSYPSMGQVP